MQLYTTKLRDLTNAVMTLSSRWLLCYAWRKGMSRKGMSVLSGVSMNSLNYVLRLLALVRFQLL